jgi:hypothetical protein
MTENQNAQDQGFPAPVHTVTLDGVTFNIRKDFYGRYQVYEVKKDNLEQGIGRMRSYASVKEAWDALFVSRMQD